MRQMIHKVVSVIYYDLQVICIIASKSKFIKNVEMHSKNKISKKNLNK